MRGCKLLIHIILVILSSIHRSLLIKCLSLMQIPLNMQLLMMSALVDPPRWLLTISTTLHLYSFVYVMKSSYDKRLSFTNMVLVNRHLLNGKRYYQCPKIMQFSFSQDCFHPIVWSSFRAQSYSKKGLRVRTLPLCLTFILGWLSLILITITTAFFI